MRDELPQSAKKRARAMRRTLTNAERRLWHALRDRRMQSIKFRRQAPIGPYIVDFLCIEHRLVVEADGSRHAKTRATSPAMRGSRMMVIKFFASGIMIF